MARNRTKTQSGSLNTTMVVILLIGVVSGFVAGFLVARDRYISKIAAISQMNMEKAVTIDDLNRQVQVLGASTAAEQ